MLKKPISHYIYYCFVEIPICKVIRTIHFYWKKGFKKKGAVEIQGSLMLLDLSDKGISRDLFQAGIREMSSTEMFKDIVKKNYVVFDIGANIGYYSLMAGKKKAEVYAIEPSSSNLDQLSKNIIFNGYDITPFHVAIGDENIDQAKIFLSDRGSNYHSFVKEDLHGNDFELVDMMTLDSFIDSFDLPCPDVVRMDVEGFEYNIVHGMKDTLDKMDVGSWVIMEIHKGILSDDQVSEILDILESNNFVVVDSFKEEKIPVFHFLRYRMMFEKLRLPITHAVEYFFIKGVPVL